MNGYAAKEYGVGIYETLLDHVNPLDRPFKKNHQMLLVADYWDETSHMETWAFGTKNNGEYLSTSHGARIAKRHGSWAYNSYETRWVPISRQRHPTFKKGENSTTI
ncbi:MAG: hypothetical protein EOM73_16895 [Bacteroidia bacterium]|nr:hypothetical protein [Bacteroidia bacterium]